MGRVKVIDVESEDQLGELGKGKKSGTQACGEETVSQLIPPGNSEATSTERRGSAFSRGLLVFYWHFLYLNETVTFEGFRSLHLKEQKSAFIHLSTS